jgi:hypothetical protein
MPKDGHAFDACYGLEQTLGCGPGVQTCLTHNSRQSILKSLGQIYHVCNGSSDDIENSFDVGDCG